MLSKHIVIACNSYPIEPARRFCMTLLKSVPETEIQHKLFNIKREKTRYPIS